MRIVAPLTALDEVAPLVEAGASVLYAGLDLNAWLDIGGVQASRWPWRTAQYQSVDDFGASAERAHSLGATLRLALNAHHYPDSCQELILEGVRQLAALDGLILSSVALACRAVEMGVDVELVASTGVHLTNRWAVNFAVECGFSTIVLPRHMTPTEIAGMTAMQPDIEYEAFVKNFDCYNVDGLCRYSHAILDPDNPDPACTQIKNVRWRHQGKRVSRDSRALLSVRDCSICQLWDLAHAGVTYAKIVGRTLPLRDRLRDVSLVSSLKVHLSEARDEFRTHARRLYGQSHPHPLCADCPLNTRS